MDQARLHRQTDGRMDGRRDRWTDGQGDSSIPPNFYLGGDIKIITLIKWRKEH